MGTSKTSGHSTGIACPARAAFSLVETVMALGIVSIAIIPVIVLLPTGLNTFRQSIDTSIASQIEQRVMNEVQQTDFTTLTGSTTAASVNTVRYFDDQANEIVPQNPPALSANEWQKVLYWVNTHVSPVTSVPGSASYSTVATVTIQVANNPAGRTINTDPATQVWSDPRFSIATYSGFVSQTNE